MRREPAPRLPVLKHSDSKAMTIYLRRRASFSAGYTQPPPGESGGGHNFVCELAVGGQIDPVTGMVVNIKDVDAVLKSRALAALDGKTLDRHVPYFRDAPPTLENLARFLWAECAPALAAQSPLHRLTLWATPLWWVQLARALPSSISAQAPEGHPMLFVTRAYEFAASHRLHSPQLSDADNLALFGKCNWPNGHGHNYEVEVTLGGEPNAHTGQILSLEALDTLVDEEILKPFDHRFLNADVPEFAQLTPTSENLTRVIWDKLARRIGDGALGTAHLRKVVVRETARNFFEYMGE